MRSVSFEVNTVKSCSMSCLFLLLGMGMNDSPFSSSDTSCTSSG